MQVLCKSVAGVAVTCVLLAGCGASNNSPTAPASNPSNQPATSTATPSKPADPASLPAPTAVKPERPTEAYVNSEEAFIEYFKYYYKLLTYTMITGDTEPIRAEIYAVDCEGCMKGFDETQQKAQKGEYSTGCAIRYMEEPRVHYYDTTPENQVIVEANANLGFCISVYGDGSLVDPNKPAYGPDVKARLYLVGQFTDGRWQVVGHSIETTGESNVQVP